jgi:hypothetical protein
LTCCPRDYPDRANIIEYFLAQARAKVGRKSPPDWADYRLATEIFLHHLFEKQHTVAQAIELLDLMCDREEKWITENGKNYSPPVKVPGK